MRIDVVLELLDEKIQFAVPNKYKGFIVRAVQPYVGHFSLVSSEDGLNSRIYEDKTLVFDLPLVVYCEKRKCFIVEGVIDRKKLSNTYLFTNAEVCKNLRPELRVSRSHENVPVTISFEPKF